MLDTITVRRMPFEFEDDIDPILFPSDHALSFQLIAGSLLLGLAADVAVAADEVARGALGGRLGDLIGGRRRDARTCDQRHTQDEWAHYGIAQ